MLCICFSGVTEEVASPSKMTVRNGREPDLASSKKVSSSPDANLRTNKESLSSMFF